MKVVISKVHELLFSGDTLSLSANTAEGRVGIFPHHEPFVTTLKPGPLVVSTPEGEKTFAVIDGVLEVSGNQATVLL